MLHIWLHICSRNIKRLRERLRLANNKYIKGVHLERKIVNAARAAGKISFRSAGSHSPIDVCIIDMDNKMITFSQCKAKKIGETEKNRILKEFSKLKGYYGVSFTLES